MRTRPAARYALSLILTVAILAVAWAARDALAQEPGELFSLGTNPTTNGFTYQGRLDVDGDPASGAYDFRFRLFDQQTGGAQVGSTNTIDDVPVTDGLFTVYLLSDPLTAVFTGAPRWLQAEVRPGSSTGAYTTLSRQPITPTPYAWGLPSGARLQGSAGGYGFGGGVLNIDNSNLLYSALEARTASGTAVRGESTGGMPLVGITGTGYGVMGASTATESARGYGGYFTSEGGVGVYGYSGASRHYTNVYTPGVYGRSRVGAGVYGVSQGTDFYAAGGRFEGAMGVYGRGAGSPPNGYGGYFTSSIYRGLYARGTPGYFAAYFDSGSPTGAGVSINGQLSVSGDLLVAGSKAGYVVEVCRNAGSEPLQTGDVVVVVGSEAAVLGEIPVMLVTLAGAGDSTAVVGVVDQPYELAAPEGSLEADDRSAMPRASSPSAEKALGTAVAGGDYVTVVTLGSFKQIRVDASFGPIAVGDLLVSSPTPGHAMRADDPKPGTVIGKALGALAEGAGLVPVLVTLD